jgi:hypothetical protein
MNKKKQKKFKREQIMFDDGTILEFVPNTEGGLKNAYIRLGERNGDFKGAIDTRPILKRIKRWVDSMLEVR